MIREAEGKLSKKTILLIGLILIAIISNFIVARIVTNPAFNAETIKALDEKKIAVLKLAGAAAATSTALSLLPGDTATPIAEQMAALSTYFIIILSAIVLEKMLVAVVGYVSFSYIIPIACLLGIIYIYSKIDSLKNLAIKLAIFGIIIFIAIPVSIKVSDLIYESHKASIEETVKTVEDNEKYIEDKKEEFSKEDQDWMAKLGGYINNITSKIGSGVSDIIKKGENTLNTFLDAVAILIITTCVVPIIVILIFIWIIKILFSFDIRIPLNRMIRKM